MTRPSNDKIKDIFSEGLGQDGIDETLFTGLDWQTLILYGKLRKELAEKYPNPKDLMVDEDDIINIEKARDDSKASLFLHALGLAESIYDRVHILQNFATEYEKKIIRLYTHITRNWTIFNMNLWKVLESKDLYELIESYFNILRKYGQQTTEEPYYFLNPEERRKIKIEGEMLKRTGQMENCEIKVSILEEIL